MAPRPATVLKVSTPLRDLTNIGPTIADRLASVGVATVGDLQRVGVARTFLKVRETNPGITIPVCYYLYSLEGALRGIHWNALPEPEKARLRKLAGIHKS